jgi:ribonuclease BN (tRNA processing enzyme)
VLGSSGPLNAEGRASTSYLLWLAGRPAIIVDVGPGSTVNLARTGANPTDLDAILLSHLHPDHVSDLPGLLWDEQVLDRNRPMLIVGPAGNRYFPDTKVFLQRLFGGAGAFPEMQAILQPFSAFHLEIRVSNIAPLQPTRVATIDGIEISAYPVPHGRAPSLAYRLEGAGFSAVLGSDQSGIDSGFANFARDADVLVLHAALGPGATDHPFAKVIGLPQTLGKLAAVAGVKRVVLSHLMAFPGSNASAGNFSLANPAAVLDAVRSTYGGDVSMASDLECITFGSVKRIDR